MHREIVIKAEVHDVVAGESSWNDKRTTVAELETKVRLQGRFDRAAVRSLVTGIVDQMVEAYDEGEGPQEPDSTPELVSIPAEGPDTPDGQL